MKDQLRFLDAGLEAIERMAAAHNYQTSAGYTCSDIRVLAACLRARLGESPRVRRDPRTGRFQSAGIGKEKPHGPI